MPGQALQQDLLYCSAQGLGRRGSGISAGQRRPNKSFKPNPLRYAKHMAGKACHVFRFTTLLGLTLVLGGSLDRSRKINLFLSIAAVICFLLAGYAYLQAAASYSLSFTFCTEPGTNNAASTRCRMPLLYGYAFWAFVIGGVLLSVTAIIRGWHRRVAAP